MAEQDPDVQGERTGSGTVINLSLISHTNVGKTTLARTLLGRDIGEVRDAAHVTEETSSHILAQAGDDALMLWDTPGFGDTARLLKRLRLSGNPLGWLLTEVWDRWRERPLWASQQAVRNARDQADVILYLVNASEDPAGAAYVPLEMEVLSWIGKPIILLLNQIGPPRADASGPDEEAERWRQAVEGRAELADILPLDAFARCWVQEGVLLEAIVPLLPEYKQPSMRNLMQQWSRVNETRFNKSMAVLASNLARAAVDREAVEDSNWRGRLTQLLSVGRAERPEIRNAMGRLADRLEADSRAATDELIRLHNLSGKASRQVHERLASHYAHRKKASEGIAAALGGLATGATTGLAADLAAGGLTLGGGLIVGAIIGALGAGGIARGFNLISGEQGSGVRWSEEFFTDMVRMALLRYLAVAHFGRGRGDWQESEYPPVWQDMVRQQVEEYKDEVLSVYKLGKDVPENDLVSLLESLMSRMARSLLERLHPPRKRLPTGSKPA